MVKRTSKRFAQQFQDYNDYHDRPFGLKWGTAFAMEELTSTIDENHLHASKDIKSKPLMSREDIDEVLSFSYIKNQPVEVQLNERDEFGRFTEPFIGRFKGEAYVDYVVIEKADGPTPYNWEDIRHVAIKEVDKLSKVELFE
ncbi:hypothetical protein ACWN8B_00090 [Vagococcus zengguangii]|uniref:Uncharacterized protein n=1 Tax=Vagococcus zengguangii TaxID=2571750 RepID=A0A4D7CVT0_9ENTE|nr:hypothetical protein [Vagococcus zengguangii]QCI86320.1 hypothetical protein FA707_04780 [Vagococcus zengguangii]